MVKKIKLSMRQLFVVPLTKQNNEIRNDVKAVLANWLRPFSFDVLYRLFIHNFPDFGDIIH